MKIKIYTLHIRDRWGGSETSVHYHYVDAVGAMLKFDGDNIDENDWDEVLALAAKGHNGDAESRLGELYDTSGHEFSIGAHEIDVDRAEKVE